MSRFGGRFTVRSRAPLARLCALYQQECPSADLSLNGGPSEHLLDVRDLGLRTSKIAEARFVVVVKLRGRRDDTLARAIAHKCSSQRESVRQVDLSSSNGTACVTRSAVEVADPGGQGLGGYRCDNRRPRRRAARLALALVVEGRRWGKVATFGQPSASSCIVWRPPHCFAFQPPIDDDLASHTRSGFEMTA